MLTQYIILLMFMLFGFRSFTEPIVIFNRIPANLQLYPRNSENQGIVSITGNIQSPGYTKMSMLIYRNNILWKQSDFNLYYKKGVSSFYFYPVINAELSEYKFEIYAKTASDSIFIAARDSITCGDVYLINGQSNSHPSSSSETFQNEYCRTFGIQTGNSNYDSYNPGDTMWSIAKGYYPNLSGLWGLQLQKLIEENNNIPVAIINGGTGGSSIGEHMKDLSASDFYTNTIYGKLLYRAQKAGVSNYIKAIFWYQGEANATDVFSYYADQFNALYGDWKNDYPSAQKIYVFQINIGCSTNGNSGNFREGQRSFKYTFPDIVTFATLGVAGYNGCHYDTSGYHSIGRQIYKLVARDFYDSNDTIEINSPDIIKAYYTSSTRKEIILEFSGTTHLIWPDSIDDRFFRNYFYLDGVSGNISSGTAGNNSVRLKLLQASNASKITYLPNSPIDSSVIFNGPYLRNSKGLCAFSFSDFPITAAPLIGQTPGCPGAFGPVKHIYGTYKNGSGGNSISVNTTWYRDTLYILHKYVRVVSGATLTIQPGTIIMGSTPPLDTSLLIVCKGAKINAVGTSLLPIVFTSCRLQGTRNYGDWVGIVLCGDAPNNEGRNIELNGNYGAIHGGINPDDNSGNFQYVRVEYAGMDFSPSISMSAVTLASLGQKTILSNVQVSYSNNDSFKWLGGTVSGRYLVSWKPLDDDFDISNGYSGYNQFGLGYRDPDMASSNGSNGIESYNNESGSAVVPKTSSTLSNFELWGPVRSTTTPYNSFFKSGAHLKMNTEIKIYNSLFIAWPSDSVKSKCSGIFIDGTSTTSNAVKDSLRIRNCISAAYPPLNRTLSTEAAVAWTPYINGDDWYNHAAYKNSAKGNVLLDQKKAPFKVVPIFTISSTTVPIASGSSFVTGGGHPLPLKSYPSGFQAVNYRGAFGGTDWTANWTEFHPQQFVYTAGLQTRLGSTQSSNLSSHPDELSLISIFPNPTDNKFTFISFDMVNDANGKVIVSDLQGKLLLEFNSFFKKGENIYSLDLKDLESGIYIIKLVISNQVFNGRLIKL